MTLRLLTNIAIVLANLLIPIAFIAIMVDKGGFDSPSINTPQEESETNYETYYDGCTDPSIMC